MVVEGKGFHSFLYITSCLSERLSTDLSSMLRFFLENVPLKFYTFTKVFCHTFLAREQGTGSNISIILYRLRCLHEIVFTIRETVRMKRAGKVFEPNDDIFKIEYE